MTGMIRVQRAVVVLLEAACGMLDKIPTWERDEHGRLVRCGGAFGCGLLGLADKSLRLDDRWGAGVWSPPRQGD